MLPGHLRGSLSAPATQQPAAWRVRFNERFFHFRDTHFARWVSVSLDNPGATVCAAAAGFAVALSLIVSQHVPFNMVVGFDLESLEANVQFASSANKQDRERFVHHLEETLAQAKADNGSENIVNHTTRANFATFNQDRLTGEQYASLNVQYAYEEQRSLPPDDFVNAWRELIVQPAYVEQLTVAVDGGQNGGQPDVTLVLRGQELAG